MVEAAAISRRADSLLKISNEPTIAVREGKEGEDAMFLCEAIEFSYSMAEQ